MTSTDLHTSGPPAWPGASLGAWATAWTAGRCAPDDVTDTLAEFADRHELVDPDGLLAGSGLADAGPASSARLALLPLLRRATDLEVRLPTAGDPQGLPPGPATAAALHAGEVIILRTVSGYGTLGLVPTLDVDVHDLSTCRWTLLGWPTEPPVRANESLGQVEYDLREAIADTAGLIASLGTVGAGARGPDPHLRTRLATLITRHQVILPPHDDRRATRVIDSAAHVEAIVTLAGAQAPVFGSTARDSAAGDVGLRRLAVLARSARAHAVNAVIREFAHRH